MNFEWNKYKLSNKLEIDSSIEYILIIPNQQKLLITNTSFIKIYNIKTLNLEGELKFDGIKEIDNLCLLNNGHISICTKNCVFLISLNEDNTYNIIQKIEFPEIEEINYKYVSELKNSNLCVLSQDKIFIYGRNKDDNLYKNILTFEENYIQYETEKGINNCCIELIYPEKGIDNIIAVHLSNVSQISFWDLNLKGKVNDTKDNHCNGYGGKNIFCLMNQGKYLFCACIDEAIEIYLTENCERIKTLYDYNWHLAFLKISENQILSGGDFGKITLYEFDFEHEYFKNKKKKLNMNETKEVEKVIDIEIPEEFEKNKKKYGHSSCIDKIMKFEDTIISSSCYEKDKKSFVCFWNKE